MKQKGFTLIELIIVIVLLGIIAVTAVPKFIDVGSDARIAKLNQMRSALKATSDLTYAKCQLSDQCDIGLWGNKQIIDIKQYCLLNGWFDAGTGGPLGADPIGTCGIDAHIDYDGFTVQIGTGADAGFEHWFLLNDSPNPDECKAIYRQPGNSSSLPSFSIETSGC